MDPSAVIREVFEAFARRDIDAVLQHVDPELEFVAPVTAELAHNGRPYRGIAGIHEYFRDVDRVWSEIRLTPISFERIGEDVLVTGRVWAQGGGRVVDSSAGWIWRLRGGRVFYGRAYTSAEEARRAAAELG